jgi:hypothetical protein
MAARFCQQCAAIHPLTDEALELPSNGQVPGRLQCVKLSNSYCPRRVPQAAAQLPPGAQAPQRSAQGAGALGWVQLWVLLPGAKQTSTPTRRHAHNTTQCLPTI